MVDNDRYQERASTCEPSSCLKELLSEVSSKCINCSLCQEDCAFLRKYGTPKEIADRYNPADGAFHSLPFECSLCELCAAVCPVEIHPAGMFLEMRREKKRRDPEDYPEYKGLLAYEQQGVSRRITYYAIPQGSDTVFFPGCALLGTRPEKTLQLYEHLIKAIPNLGIVLDCCTKISHDLGRDEYFQAMFREMRDYLTANGIRQVIVACPNCFKIFKTHGEGLVVKTAYEVLSGNMPPIAKQVTGAVTIHDPCALRFESPVHDAVRKLVEMSGLQIEEMKHSGRTNVCCGAGGSVKCVSPDLAGNWAGMRKAEASGRRIITYCAGCTAHLDETTPTSHVVDLLFDPVASLEGTLKIPKGPMTYLNRLKLKKQIRKTVHAPVTRERTFSAGAGEKKGIMIKRLLILGFLIGVILAVRFSGVSAYLEQETLRQWIAGYGIWAPVTYMLIYAIAPALLLPGLPITIAGGVLFGPFWGVIYTITSATIGASIAFLVARYIARDWVEKKLKGPRWQRLDQGVEKHGWKIVAFTRLIPLFPFNLLNYAFGLTRIKFLHYAVATFFFMLPACVAFIVFSSSLLDLIRGQVSINFILGLVLVTLVALIPFAYRCYKTRKGMDDLV